MRDDFILGHAPLSPRYGATEVPDEFADGADDGANEERGINREGAAPSRRLTARPYDASRPATVAGSKLPPLRTITVGCSALPDGTLPVR